MIEGHGRTDKLRCLIARAFAAMTDGGAFSFESIGESKPALGFRRSARMQAMHSGTTGRNLI